jgi:hypothetical protein
VLVASAGSLVSPQQRGRRRAGRRAAWPPFQSAEECRQACTALAGCNAFRFCSRQDGCPLGDCAGWWRSDNGGGARRLQAPPSSSSSSRFFNATAAGLLQLPVRALGPFGGDAWGCVEPGKESAAAERRAAAAAAYASSSSSSSPSSSSSSSSASRRGRRRRRALAQQQQQQQNKQQPPRWPYGTCTLLRVQDPRNPPSSSSSSSSSWGGGGGWRSGGVVLPELCSEGRTGQRVPPSADACRACLSAARSDGRVGAGPSPDVCASCAAAAAATGEERSGGGSGGKNDPLLDGRRVPVYAAMARAASAAARGPSSSSSPVLLGLQPACVSSCAAAGSGGERDAAWKCPGCVLSRSPCARCFSDRARRAALSAAFGGSGADSGSSGGPGSSSYDAGACVACMQDVAKGGGRDAEALLFGGCVACASHTLSVAGGGTGGGGGTTRGRCARCLAAAAGQRPWWWPAARRPRDRTPCDVCDASVAPGDDAAFDACVGCFRDSKYRGGADCLRCALLQDPESVRRCYNCVSRSGMSDPRQRGCADCLDYYTPVGERERCLACVESGSVVGAAKAACSLCTADTVVDPGEPGATDARRPAVGDKGQCLACLGQAGLGGGVGVDAWRQRCVRPAGSGR